MGGCRCSYKTCTNTTKTRENLHFFHYPVKQKDRCKQWIENANKPQFYDLDEDQLRNKVICETHFENYYFPNVQKKRLLQGAIPTLDGDCENVPADRGGPRGGQDVQVLPTNADGTIFILETNNLQSSFQSDRIESYIYTSNGLVLPIEKCNDVSDECLYEMSQEIDCLPTKYKLEARRDNSCESLDCETNYVFQSTNGYEKPAEKNSMPDDSRTQQTIQVTEDVIYKAVGTRFVKKIKQHSKDIAILKRMLKSQKAQHRKPNNATMLHLLKRQLPPSLLSLVNLNINPKCELAKEELEFFSTIYNTSPDVYQLLAEKYNWKVPALDTINIDSTGDGQ